VDRAVRLLTNHVADPTSVAMPREVSRESATRAIKFLRHELTRESYASQPLPDHVGLDDLIEQRAFEGLRDRTFGEISRDRATISLRRDIELREQLATFRARRLRSHEEPGQHRTGPPATEKERS
jgi:hypothetical protein